MKHAEILFGVAGQRLYFDPPELARAASPTATVYRLGIDDDGTPETATTGAVAVDAVDTTLAEAAHAGNNVLELASGTDVARWRRYLLTSTATGLAEHVDSIGVVGAAVALQRPLLNDYAVGAKVQGTRISVALDASWTATKAKLSDVGDCLGYRVRWTYTVDGEPQVAVTYFDLVRYSARQLVTAADIDGRFPGWIDRLPPDHRENQGASLIAAALEDVKLDALGDAQQLRRLRDTQVIRELIMAKADVLAIEAQVRAGSANTDGLTTARDHYDQRYRQLVREPKVSVDNAGGGAATGPAERLPVWRR